METKLLIASVTLEEYRLRKLEAELLFKAAMSTHTCGDVLPLNIVNKRWHILQYYEEFLEAQNTVLPSSSNEQTQTEEVPENVGESSAISVEEPASQPAPTLTELSEDSPVLNLVNENKQYLLTKQKIADAVKALQNAEASIADPITKVDQLLPPTVNVNRKGRKSNKGPKDNTKRMALFVEQFNQSQEKLKKKEAKIKKNEGVLKATRRKMESIELDEQL
ncbi:hypothetical protein MUCCIDRAFT_81263 [Mucor lusitanicus CBS 277.49]|uniref:Uncharacterized protein n=1 Tax=Mucor lusitanicus CBS 277.49 TaxID=747725 RepID=A0A162TB62_MUCCL|nr:hypothetical protein MUCCIDRAFT_81263 [Mucor lusitanicus CBS 277.49]